MSDLTDGSSSETSNSAVLTRLHTRTAHARTAVPTPACLAGLRRRPAPTLTAEARDALDQPVDRDSDPDADELLRRVKNPRTPQPRTLTSYTRRDVRNTIATARGW